MSTLILPYKGITPKIHNSAFIAPNCSIIGDVTIGEESNIWYGCVLRGDVNNIRIGARTNVQDATVIHVASKVYGTNIGNDVTIGHGALLHACTVEDFGFIGMQACAMDGSVIESFAMLAAGALLTPEKRIPKGQLWSGRPARYMRNLTDKDMDMIKWSSAHYVYLGKEHSKAIEQKNKQVN